VGQEFLYGYPARPFGMPTKNSPLLCHGDGIPSPIKDMLDNIRPKGATHLLHQGTATSATNRTLTDTSKSFGGNTLAGYTIEVLSGPGAGETKTINGNTTTSITGDGQWITAPTSVSKYAIYQGPTSMNSLVSTGTVSTITDNYANWGANFWQGYTMMITSGNASGQNFIVSGNSPTTLTGYYPLSVIPASGNVYELFWGAMLKGRVSTGTSSTITDNTANWPIGNGPTGLWINNWRCMIYEGVASGANFAISGNSPNTFSGWNTLSVIPASGDKYVVFRNTDNLTGYCPSGYHPPYSREYIQSTVGCYSVTDTAVRETGVVLSGSNSIKLFGPASHDFKIPVMGNTLNTISVFGRFDEFYLGVKPQIILLNCSGCGVAENTGVMNGISGQWEKLTLSFTPTTNGVITARLQSNTTGIGGSCYFDSFQIY
jgi:hypothetical protein